MKMLIRVCKFDRQDWKHIGFLLKNMLNQLFVKYNWHEAKEAYIFIKIHLSYDSTRVE